MIRQNSNSAPASSKSSPKRAGSNIQANIERAQNGTISGDGAQTQNGTISGGRAQAQNGTISGGRAQNYSGTISGGEIGSQTVDYVLALRHVEKQRRQGIKVSLDCYRLCLQTVSHCLRMGGRYVEDANLQLLFECADACNTAVSMMMRNHGLQATSCGLPSRVRERCAAMCEQFSDDPQMQHCAQLCRKSAAICQKLITA